MARDLPQIEAFPGEDDRDGFLVRTPWSEGFLEEMKAQVSYRDRQWRSWAKTWWIAAEHEDLIRHLIVRHFGDYAEVGDEGTLIHTARGERLSQGGLF